MLQQLVELSIISFPLIYNFIVFELVGSAYILVTIAIAIF